MTKNKKGMIEINKIYCENKQAAKQWVSFKVEHQHNKVILTNAKRDTYTSKSEELMDFLAGASFGNDIQFYTKLFGQV